tara:strand:+ start:209 stop:940 length:732 start_codon:yes stop_codon:yes gene_type:complete
MKNQIIIIWMMLFIVSCSTSNSVVSNKIIQKRKYNKGYNINNFKVRNTNTELKEEAFIASTKNNENSYVIPNYKLITKSIFKNKNSAKKEIKLKSGTLVELANIKLLSSEDKTLFIGKEVELRVSRDIKKDGHILIERDARAYGKITNLKKKKGGGQPGEIGIKVDRVTAVDDQTIFLSGEQIYVQGEDKKTSFWVCMVLYFLLLLWLLLWVPYVLIKGDEGVIYPDTRISARTISEADIEID